MRKSLNHLSEVMGFQSSFVQGFCTLSVCALAISVNLGVALVSLSAGMMLLALIFTLISKQSLGDSEIIESNLTVKIIFFSIAWFLISTAWSIADWPQVGSELVRYSRLLIVPLTLFLIRKRAQAMLVLHACVLSHCFVILSSILLWMSVPVFWATSDWATINFTPFTSSLEQPIMSALIFAVLWYFRDHFCQLWSKKIVYLILFFILIDVFFLMIGRSGILSMIVVLTLIIGFAMRPKLRYLVVLVPFVIFGILFLVSSRFEQRVTEIPYQIAEYEKGKLETSQAQRLEFWNRSVQAVKQRPWLGSGVGSWPSAYQFALNGEIGLKADSPHQQFFLWWVEGGAIGLTCLICFFVCIYLDSLKLEQRAKEAVITVLVVLIFTSLMNCPLQGAGICEFFSVIIASLMVFRESGKSI